MDCDILGILKTFLKFIICNEAGRIGSLCGVKSNMTF